MRRRRALILLALAVLLALLLRSLGLSRVFGNDEEIFLKTHDSAYHARRALFSFVEFPSVLTFDPYIAYPSGATVPMPPLFDWVIAAVARLFGDTLLCFERVAAWASPVPSALTLLPIYGIGAVMGGRGLGLGAALIFAVLPASVMGSQIGDVDHHAAVGLLGALLLYASVELVASEGRRGRRTAASLGLMVVGAALVLTWSGSLLYVALCEGALLITALLVGRPAILWGQAGGALGAALLVLPWVAFADEPIAGPFTATTLSWFHVVALTEAGVTAALLAILSSTWLGQRIAIRLGMLVAVAAGLSGLVVLIQPALIDALAPAASFLSKTDPWGPINVEQQAIFQWREGSFSAVLAHQSYGLLAYVIPLAALCILERVRDPRLRGPAICLFCWNAVLGVLAVSQVRYASDFAPVGALGFGMLLHLLARALARPLPRIPSLIAAWLAAALALWPGISATWAGDLGEAMGHFGTRPSAEATRRLSGRESLAAFARMIRAATPETSGYFDPDVRPEYGILCRPAHGHTLHYYARRATPANNFGPYLDVDKYRAVRRFYSARSEGEAVRIAQQLNARYVMTFAMEDAPPRSFVHGLHRDEQGGAGRFRLIIEGPKAGVPLPALFPSRRVPRGTVPYKLFEVVEGAVLAAHGAPGSEMVAQVEVVSSLGRRFPFTARTRADEDGWARLRVPYATQTEHPTHALGPYHVRFGNAETLVAVEEEEVLGGVEVRVRESGR